MNHTFEYTFIPQLVSNSNTDDFELDSLEVLDDFEFVEGAFEDKYPKEAVRFDWKSLHITKEMSYDMTYWLMQFPELQKEGEAKWGLVLKKQNKPFVYYLFEKCEDGKFVLVELNESTRSEHGFYESDMTVDTFVDTVCVL